LISIEFPIPASYEEVEEIFQVISQTSYFEIKPDPAKKTRSRTEAAWILLYDVEDQRPELIGLIDVLQTKEKETIVTINQMDPNGQGILSETGSRLTRFVSLLAQNLIRQGMA